MLDVHSADNVLLPPPGPLLIPAAPRYVLPKGGTSEWRGRLGTAMALLLGSKLLNVQVGYAVK